MLLDDLRRRDGDGNPIRVAVSGAGWIGSGFVAEAARIKGMRVSLLADEDTALARRALESTGVPADRIVETNQASRAEDALRAGKRVITGSYGLAAQLAGVDIVVDVTPSPAIGAETAWSCIQNRKNVVLVNIEADVTVGRILKHLADRAGIHLYHEPWLTPLPRPLVDVLTIAKKDLAPGESLDEFGGFTFHGSIDTAEEARKLSALPVGIAPGARVTRPVRKGAVITWNDVQLDETQTVIRLRRQQDSLSPAAGGKEVDRSRADPAAGRVKTVHP